MSRRISELGADVGNALGNNDGGDDVGDDDVDALLAMHLATSAVAMLAMHSNLCCAELFGDVGDWRFDSIDSIGWKVYRSHFKCALSSFLYNRRVLQLLPFKKEKKVRRQRRLVFPANLTARQFLQYIR